MRTTTITPELVDIDVCYGDYDGFVTREYWNVDCYKNGELMYQSTHRYEDVAKMRATLFENGIDAFVYFEDAEVGEDA